MGKGADAPDVAGAARIEAAAAKEAAMREAYTNRPNQYGPVSQTEWQTGSMQDPSSGEWVTTWDQNTALTEPWQQYSDTMMGGAMDASKTRQGIANDWADNPVDSSRYGYTDNTIQGNEWQGFGTDPTTSATGYQQFGTTDPNLGADDWRQFGQAQPTVNSGTYDERFGSAGDNPYGAHGMDGGDWNMVGYQPEYIRQQAQDQMYAYDTARLDPQFEQSRKELETKLANQGLALGDQAYDSAMTSFSNNKNRAYEDARNQSMEASRAEASMLWDQEMGASEQKNRYAQQDTDNQFRARQSNIQNYLSGREQDMSGYLDYSNAAYNQDYQNKQQAIDANRQYAGDAYSQDLQSRQQQLQSDLDYSRQNYEQQYQQNQSDLANQLRYGESAFNQDLQGRDQAQNAAYYAEQAQQGRYNALNPEGTMQAVSGLTQG